MRAFCAVLPDSCFDVFGWGPSPKAKMDGKGPWAVLLPLPAPPLSSRFMEARPQITLVSQALPSQPSSHSLPLHSHLPVSFCIRDYTRPPRNVRVSPTLITDGALELAHKNSQNEI